MHMEIIYITKHLNSVQSAFSEHFNDTILLLLHHFLMFSAFSAVPCILHGLLPKANSRSCNALNAPANLLQ